MFDDDMTIARFSHPSELMAVRFNAPFCHVGNDKVKTSERQ